MRLAYWLTAVGEFFSLGVGVAAASTTDLSTNPSYASGPFSFYCSPYIYAFEAEKHYLPTATNGTCTYSIPDSIPGDTKIIALYKGIPGNSLLIAVDQVRAPYTLVQQTNLSFGSPAPEQDYFGAVYDVAYAQEFADAFRYASTTPTFTYPASSTFAIVPWRWGPKPADEYDPVVIIPGITGSWEKNGEWVVDPILHTYDNLIDTFLANGYVEGKTLFKFGYDWEEPNEVSAHLLANKIGAIKTICGCEHVDVIAHSVGGLVALHYIENSEYKKDIDQLFLVATPILGAPFAYNAWEGGMITSSSSDPFTIIYNNLRQRIFSREARDAGYNNIFEYIRGKPVTSVQELLPIYDYLFDVNNNNVLTYPTGYPRNTFLENIRDLLFSKARNLAQISYLSADNNKYDTVSWFEVKPSSQLPLWPDGQPSATYFDAGDDTVPSAPVENFYGVPEKIFFGSNHNSIASTSAAYIFKQLNNKEPGTIIGKIYKAIFNADYSILIDRLAPSKSDFPVLADTIKDFMLQHPGHTALFLLLFSPIDMQITAPDGRHLGKDLSTGNVVNEIPEALYSGPKAEHEYALILDPLPGSYKVETIGTGSGPYTIATSFINQSTSSISAVAGTTTLGQVISNTLILSSTTTVIAIIKDTPLQPVLTPDTCVTDITKAYQDQWISKKIIYDGLVFDCKTLKVLFWTKDSIEKTPIDQRTRTQKTLLAATVYGIKRTLDHMDLLATDKTNTKDAVELIHKYTLWFRNQLTQ